MRENVFKKDDYSQMSSGSQMPPKNPIEMIKLGLAGLQDLNTGEQRSIGSITGQSKMEDPEGGFNKEGREHTKQWFDEHVAEIQNNPNYSPSKKFALITALNTAKEGAAFGSNVIESPMTAGLGEPLVKSAIGATSVVKPALKTIAEETAKIPGISHIIKAKNDIGNVVGDRLQKVGSDLQYRVLKPGINDERKGFDIDNVWKYGVEGSPDDVLAQSDKIIKNASKEMKYRIKKGKDEGVVIDVPAQIEASLKPILEDKAGSKENMELVMFIENEAKDAIKQAEKVSKNGDGKLDLMEAQNFKQLMGDKGAWLDIAKKKNIPVNKKESEESKTAELIYRHLNDVIDESTPEGIKDLNKKISDLLSVRSTAAYRKIIADRQNKFGMNEALATLGALHSGIGGMGMYTAYKLGGSGKFAGKLYRAGESMKTAPLKTVEKVPVSLKGNAADVKYPKTSKDLKVK